MIDGFVKVQEIINVEIVIQDQEIESLGPDVKILDHVIIDRVLEIEDERDLEIDARDQRIDGQDREIVDRDLEIVKRLARGGIQIGHLDQ